MYLFYNFNERISIRSYLIYAALVYVCYRQCIFFFEVVYSMKLEAPQQRAGYHLVNYNFQPTMSAYTRCS
jgi:hypothetical protein